MEKDDRREKEAGSRHRHKKFTKREDRAIEKASGNGVHCNLAKVRLTSPSKEVIIMDEMLVILLKPTTGRSSELEHVDTCMYKLFHRGLAYYYHWLFLYGHEHRYTCVSYQCAVSKQPIIFIKSLLLAYA